MKTNKISNVINIDGINYVIIREDDLKKLQKAKNNLE